MNLSLKSLLTNIGSLLSGSIAARALAAITHILISRLLGPDIFGQYAASLALARIASVCFTLGLDAWLLRSGGQEDEQLRLKSSSSLGLRLAIGLVWLLGVVLVAPFLNADAFPPVVLILCAISVWFDEIATIIATAFQAALKNRTTMILLAGAQFLQLVSIITLVALAIIEIEAFLWARVVASLLAALVSFVLMLAVFGLQFDLQDMKLALRETLPFGASAALGTISRQADVTIVAYWLGKTAAGLYSPAITITSTLFLIPHAIHGIALPILSRAYRHTPKLVPKMATQLTLLTAVLGTFLGIIMTFLARPLILFIYTDAYAASGDILTIFSSILGFRCVIFGTAAVLAAVGWQNKRVGVQIISVILNIGLNLLVVIPYQLVGVAWVYVFTEVVLMVGYTSYTIKWIKQQKSLESSQIKNYVH